MATVTASRLTINVGGGMALSFDYTSSLSSGTINANLTAAQALGVAKILGNTGMCAGANYDQTAKTWSLALSSTDPRYPDSTLTVTVNL